MIQGSDGSMGVIHAITEKKTHPPLLQMEYAGGFNGP